MPNTQGSAAIGGTWTAYTPAVGGTGWALGNGTITGLFARIGKVVYVRVSVTWGSTSTYGSGTPPTFTLPSTAASVYAADGNATAASIGVNEYRWQVFITTTAIGPAIFANDTGASTGLPNGTQPFVWKATDQLHIIGVYAEA